MMNDPVSVTGAEREDRFYRIFNLLPDAVLLARADDSAVLDVNEAFEKLTGYRGGTIVGRPVLSLVFFLDPDLWTQMSQDMNVTGVVHGIDTRLLRADGRIAFVRMRHKRTASTQRNILPPWTECRAGAGKPLTTSWNSIPSWQY